VRRRSRISRLLLGSSVNTKKLTFLDRSATDRIQTSDLKPIDHDHKKLRSQDLAIDVWSVFLDEADAMPRVHRISTICSVIRINYQ
jgi:hypothetical protein